MMVDQTGEDRKTHDEEKNLIWRATGGLKFRIWIWDVVLTFNIHLLIHQNYEKRGFDVKIQDGRRR